MDQGDELGPVRPPLAPDPARQHSIRGGSDCAHVHDTTTGGMWPSDDSRSFPVASEARVGLGYRIRRQLTAGEMTDPANADRPVADVSALRATVHSAAVAAGRGGPTNSRSRPHSCRWRSPDRLLRRRLLPRYCSRSPSMPTLPAQMAVQMSAAHGAELAHSVESRCGAVAVVKFIGHHHQRGTGQFPRHSSVSTSRSSNRTCRSPASGSRTRPHAFTHGWSLPRAVSRTSPKCP